MDKVIPWLKAMIIMGASVFAPIHALLYTTGVMVVVDLITGVLAAKKRGSDITSAGLRRTVTKIFVYEAALMLGYLAETYMSDVLPFVKMASGAITLVEMTSIFENLNSISGTNLFQALIDRLGSANQDDKS